jgi:hypothetical protein
MPMKPTKTPPLPADLARAFTRRLARQLSPWQIQRVRARNRRETHPFTCHSHDFCDANDVMAAAFRTLTGRTVNTQTGADRALWNAAWALARQSEFR